MHPDFNIILSNILMLKMYGHTVKGDHSEIEIFASLLRGGYSLELLIKGKNLLSLESKFYPLSAVLFEEEIHLSKQIHV